MRRSRRILLLIVSSTTDPPRLSHPRPDFAVRDLTGPRTRPVSPLRGPGILDGNPPMRTIRIRLRVEKKPDIHRLVNGRAATAYEATDDALRLVRLDQIVAMGPATRSEDIVGNGRWLNAGGPPELELLALTALEALAQAVAVVDADGQILLRNRAFQNLLGARGCLEELLPSIEDWTPGAPCAEVLLRDGRTVRLEARASPQGCVLALTEITEQVAERTRQTQAASTDPLTGLASRLAFRERLADLQAGNPGREAHSSAVLSLSLDRFNGLNDTLGRPVGDALLRVVADRIRSALGPADMAARFAGDKFGVLQTGRPQPHSAAALAKRLVDLLGRAYIIGGHLVNIGASVGIALVSPELQDGDQILKNAGLALSRAKQSGTSTFRFFEAAMDEQMQARRSLELDLRRALALRQLALVYQPQYNLAAERTTGFEALLRWNHPVRGFVSPAEFIPLAEEIGLIVPIGEWVIRTACREAVGWAEPLKVAVNISALQFASSLVTTVLSALAESGLEPGRLELEITESVLLDRHGSALDQLQRLRDIGVRVSMDDFGTGYSSLSCLRSFPFDTIKIDQSFVRVDENDPSGVAIVHAIAALGRSLGMTTTAEGVETAEQMARIAADGCTDVQGYLISRPLPPDRIVEFLQSEESRSETGFGANEVGTSN